MMDKCDICGEALQEDKGVWNISFDYINPAILPQEQIVCCHTCKLNIRDYIRRYSNIKLAERGD
jgi:hypothetical protein